MSQYYTPTLASPQYSSLSALNLAARSAHHQPPLKVDSGPTPPSPNSLVSGMAVHSTVETSAETCRPVNGECRSFSTDPSDKPRESSFIDQNGRRRRRLAPTVVTDAPSKVNSPKIPPADVTSKINSPISIDQVQETSLREPQIYMQDVLEDSGCQVAGQIPLLSPKSVEVPDGTASRADQHVDDVTFFGPTLISPSSDENRPDLPPHQKRLKPTFVGAATKQQPCDLSTTQVDSSHRGFSPVSSKKPSNSQRSALGKHSKRTPDQIYYGASAFPVDGVFYDDIALGETASVEVQTLSSEEQEMVFDSTGQISSAQRSWVNSRMKYFFRNTVDQGLIIDVKNREVGLVPYPDRIGPKRCPLSMTVFSRSANGISKTRTNRLNWLAKAFPTGTSNIFNVSDSSITMAVDDRDWDSLEKWNYMDGDRVLPVYGDSDSGEDYDSQTWAEMEAENRTPTIRVAGSSRSPKLTPQEIEAAIDKAMELLCEEWQIKQQPKLQHKAWRIWAKARRDRKADAQVEHILERLTALDGRLSKLRSEICKEEWSNDNQVIKQCRSMQLSLFEREESQWKLAILKSESPPEKLPPPIRNAMKIKIPKITELQHDNEDIDIVGSSADDEESSDDDLDDFIVDDELCSGKDYLMQEDNQGVDIADDNENDIFRDIPVDSKRMSARRKKESYSSESAIPTISTISKAQQAQKQMPDIIDLTQASDPPIESPPRKGPSQRIVTPPIFQEDEDSDAWFARTRSIKAEFKPPPKVEDLPTTNSSNDSSGLEIISTPVPVKLPPLDDIQAIRKLNAAGLVEKQDRKRLLIWLVAGSKDHVRDSVLGYLQHVDVETCLSQIKEGLMELHAGRLSIANKDQETSNGILQVVAWYVGWTIPVKLNKKGISKGHIETTLENDDGFDDYYQFLLECLELCKRSMMPSISPSIKRKTKRNAALMEGTPNEAQIKKKKKVEIISGPSAPSKTDKGNKGSGTEEEEEEEDLSDSAALAHVRNAVLGSQETLQKRDAALQRMHEDSRRVEQRALRDGRRRELMPRLEALAALQTEASEVILNPGKLNDRDLIRLNSEFGRGAQLKPHQKEGLQLMWREITGDHEDLQGCLLAQTMGLGKTVQVIALLIAISDAANSPQENIRSQVPVGLRDSQTLVLCPPGLIENWWDEFLLWPPATNHLGELRKVTASFVLAERVNEVLAWEQEGGILLMGYHTFRDLIHNKPRYSKSATATGVTGLPPLNEEQHRRVKSTLLERPNLVVADEAHEFKNLQSEISKAINQIKCKSRIALTGSPLSNNLGEYFATIDWIAPSYLGTESDFRNAYAMPIHQGLQEDATSSQYRESRKRLKALELELEPKIHRADFNALHGNLHGKYDVIVRLPLTPFQDRLYRDLLSAANFSSSEETASFKATRVWSCLAILQLVCNHPGSEQPQPSKTFDTHSSTDSPANGNKRTRSTGKKGQSRDRNGESSLDMLTVDEEPMLDDSMTEPTLSTALKRSREEFKASGGDIDALELSNKMQVLMKIIELSGAAGDKVLVFSHRHPTLDYVEKYLRKLQIHFSRIDGRTPPTKRPQISKSFNEGSIGVCLISTRAGGQGLNLFGANRVVIMDSNFNPMWEQQAVGRAYRIGQKKPVFIYRLMVAGTFEEEMQKQGLYKEQLVTRVLEKRNPHRIGSNRARQYLFAPKEVKKEDITGFKGEDHLVLDHLLRDEERAPIVSITRFDTFHVDDGQELTPQEYNEAQQIRQVEKLRRQDPAQFYAKYYPSSAGHNAATSSGAFNPTQNSLSSSVPVAGSSPQYGPALHPRHGLPRMSLGIPYNQPSINVKGLGEHGSSTQTPWHELGVPRVDGGPVVPKPSPNPFQSTSVEEQLLPPILDLISSQRLQLQTEHIPHKIRKAVRRDIYRVTKPLLSHDPAWEYSENLRGLILKHAKSLKHFLNIGEAVQSVLERKDVNPHTLLKLMMNKIEKSKLRASENANDPFKGPLVKTKNARGLKASDPIEIDEIIGSNDGKSATGGPESRLGKGKEQDAAPVAKDALAFETEVSERLRPKPAMLDAVLPGQEDKENTPAVAEADHNTESKTKEGGELPGLTSKPNSTMLNDEFLTTVPTLEPQEKTQ